MKERGVSFSYFDMIYIIIITFLSFQIRNFRLARPQSPIYCEDFEIDFYKNYSNTGLVNGEEKALSRILKYFYIYFAQVNIDSNFTIKSNQTDEYQYKTYRYVSLRQYSSFFSLLCPPLLYIYLIYINVNSYIAKCATLFLIFNESITTESRVFSSSGLYQITFILTLMSLTLFSQYDNSSIYYYFALIFSSFFMFLSFNLHQNKSLLLLIFYILYFYSNRNRNMRSTISQFTIEVVVLIIPLILSIYYAQFSERVFLKVNKYKKLTEIKNSDEYIYQKVDFPSCIIILTTIALFCYTIFYFQNGIHDLSSFLFLFVSLFSFSSLFGTFYLFRENTIEIISSLIITSKILSKTNLSYKKYVSFAITFCLIITVLFFIYHAQYIYIYDRNHPEQ